MVVNNLVYKGDKGNSVMVGAEALLKAASKINVLEKVLTIVKSLQPTPTFVLDYYTKGIERFGDDWGYSDLLTILYVASKWLQPKSYLEVGVAWGRSGSIVCSNAKECRYVGVDLWPHKNQNIVEDNFKSVGHIGKRTFYRGDSHRVLPKLNEGAFDLILVDGDHTKEGAIEDLKHTIPLLNLGGILVFDDISAYWLREVWHTLLENNSRFSTAKYFDSGPGTGIAIRRI